MRQGIARLVFALCALASAGCNVLPTKAYEGPSRRDRDLSFVKGGGSGEENGPKSLVDLRVVDGRPQRARTYFVSVLPGRRAIGLSDTLRIGTRDRIQFCAFELETVAGCTYLPSPPSPPADAARVPSWEWDVDMLVSAECIADGGYQVRVPARCGSTAKVFERIAK